MFLVGIKSSGGGGRIRRSCGRRNYAGIMTAQVTSLAPKAIYMNACERSVYIIETTIAAFGAAGFTTIFAVSTATAEPSRSTYIWFSESIRDYARAENSWHNAEGYSQTGRCDISF